MCVGAGGLRQATGQCQAKKVAKYGKERGEREREGAGNGVEGKGQGWRQRRKKGVKEGDSDWLGMDAMIILVLAVAACCTFSGRWAGGSSSSSVELCRIPLIDLDCHRGVCVHEAREECWNRLERPPLTFCQKTVKYM